MIWKPVPEFVGVYEISDTGLVRRIAGGRGAVAGRILRPIVMRSGHLRVRLHDLEHVDLALIHRLVARAFHGEPQPGHEARHYDGNPRNNRVENIRWGTRAQNLADSVRLGTHPQTRKVACPQGHGYTPDNTYVRKTATGVNRQCRACRRV
jgi:hypothetical protein